MIDRLRSIALSVRRLATPAIAVALLCFVYATYTALTSTSVEDDRYLFPSILGFMWMLSFYAFVETFIHVPQRSQAKTGLFARAKQRLIRLWYWTVGLVFLVSSVAAAGLTLRVLVVWYRNY